MSCTPTLLMAASDAAKALAVCEKTLWSLAKRGEIPVVEIGRRRLYDPADLARFIEEQKRKGGTP